MKVKTLPLKAVYLWLLLFCLIPMLMVLGASFLTDDPQRLIRMPFTLEQYKNLFSSSFVKIFGRSLWMALNTTFFCLLLAYPFSYLLTKSKHQPLLVLLIIIPFWTSSLIRTYSLIAILKFKGLLNALLLKLHIIDTPLSLLYNNTAVIIGLVYNLFPFMVLPILNNMQRFDFQLLDAAKDLGASRSRLFTHVFLPNTLSGIISGCMMVFLPAMTLFYIPSVLGGARSMLLGNVIQDQFLLLEDWPQGAASSVVLTLLLLILLVLFKRAEK